MMMKRAPLLLVALLLLSSMPFQQLELTSTSYSTSNNSELSDVPTWRVGDKWVYSGLFDAEQLIKDNGVSASVGEIQGDAEMVVIEILTMQIENKSTLVYKTRMTAEFDKNGVELRFIH
jgi:hypothetical protein